jgi:hypothetical protein
MADESDGFADYARAMKLAEKLTDMVEGQPLHIVLAAYGASIRLLVDATEGVTIQAMLEHVIDAALEAETKPMAKQ